MLAPPQIFGHEKAMSIPATNLIPSMVPGRQLFVAHRKPSGIQVSTIMPLLGGFIGVALLAGLALVVYLWVFAPPASERDLSAPSSRVVGHWQLMIAEGRPFYDLYFGPVSTAGERKGFASMVDEEGMTFIGSYQIIREDTRNNLLVISKNLGPGMQRDVEMSIAENGLRGSYRYRWFDRDFNQAMVYVDDLIAPATPNE